MILCLHKGEQIMTIKQLRRKLRLTQSEFADKVGVTRQTVNGWETGYKNPSFRSLRIIEKMFEVKIKD